MRQKAVLLVVAFVVGLVLGLAIAIALELFKIGGFFLTIGLIFFFLAAMQLFLFSKIFLT